MNERPFAEVYSEWMDSRQNKRRLRAELRSRYQAAWTTGDYEDRWSVVTYMLFAKEEDGASIIIDALRSTDSKFALHAGAVGWSLVFDGFDLGGETRPAFEEYGERHPEWSLFAALALDHLDRREKPDHPFITELAALAKDKRLKIGSVCDELAAELASTYAEHIPGAPNLSVKIDRRAGFIRVYRVFDVVEHVENEVTQTTIEDAQDFRVGAALGERVLFESQPSFEGRAPGQAVKARFLERLRAR